MRKILLTILIVLVVLVGAVIALPFVLPTSIIKAQLEQAVASATGREFRIAGDLTPTFWPPLSVHASDVSLANPEWANAPDLVKLGSLDAEIDVLAYLRGVIAINRFVLDAPEVNLEVAEDGRQSWAFDTGGEQETTDAGDSEPAEPSEAQAVVLGDIRIENGTITYDDRQNGMQRRAENVRLALSQTEAGGPLAITGGLESSGKPLELTGEVTQPQALAEGNDSPLKLNLTAPGTTFAFTGVASGAGPGLVGDVNLDMPGIRELADWAGQPIDAPAGTIERLSFTGKVDANPSRASVSGMQLGFDDITATGDVAADLSAARPRITGQIDVGPLNLDPYRPPEEQGEPPLAAEPEGGDQAQQGWPTDPLNLPLPLPVDSDLTVNLTSLQATPVQLGSSRLTLQSDATNTAFRVEGLEAYRGTVDLDAAAKTEGSTPPAFTVNLNAQQLDMLPILQSFAGFDRLAGSGNARAALTTGGASVRDLVQGLNGDAEVRMRDGAIRGVNLAALFRGLATLNLDPNAGQAQQTDFAELGGTFRIANGIVQNDDLALRAPVIRLSGAGRVDLPSQSLDYTVRPEIASTLEGQDATNEANLALGVPVKITGPWSSPSYQLDLGGELTSAFSNPDQLRQAAEGILSDPDQRGALQDQLRNLGGGGDELEGALRGLLGGGNSSDESGSGRNDNEGGGGTRQLLEGLGRSLR
ncbi:AsmA family protein [Marinivivus vitaminiproducens]|uniref:AsmA family protein n=1 Tax=Marinivivus vitaminiproducens TaxID=3035935 RepID=UPI00279C0231|nr:AsmA family protein [Geminicoccaceae bacterium SCSIO 64248]